MDKFVTIKFRRLKPFPTSWITTKAIDEIDAIQKFHFDNYNDSFNCVVKTEQGNEKQYFALFELNGGKTLISRVVSSGLYRSGGVKPLNQKSEVDVKKEIAEKLGTTVENLFNREWERDEPEGWTV